MIARAGQILMLAEALRHCDETLATDLNAANLFVHNVISRILLVDPELTEIPTDPECLRKIAVEMRAVSALGVPQKHQSARSDSLHQVVIQL